MNATVNRLLSSVQVVLEELSAVGIIGGHEVCIGAGGLLLICMCLCMCAHDRLGGESPHSTLIDGDPLTHFLSLGGIIVIHIQLAK